MEIETVMESSYHFDLAFGLLSRLGRPCQFQYFLFLLYYIHSYGFQINTQQPLGFLLGLYRFTGFDAPLGWSSKN